MTRNRGLITAFTAILIIIACAKKEEPKVEAKTYQGDGIVTAVDQENGTITINHEEIPEFMNAMTMQFPVKPRNILSEIQPGDKINFTITETKSEFFVSEIKKNKSN